MLDNIQQPLFYDDMMDALNKMIMGNPKGLSMKQIAMELWPARNPDTARSEFSRCLNPEDHSHNLDPEEIIKTMDISGGPEHIIFFLCDEFGFERPMKKDKESFKKEVKGDLKNIMENLKHLTRKVEALENGK